LEASEQQTVGLYQITIKKRNLEMTLNSDQNNNHVIDKHEKGRSIAIGAASVVYVGVVAATTILFISFVLEAFPPTAYFSQFIMALAGVLVGGSMLAFPVALHNWAVHAWHRKIAVALYYGEIFIVGVNTIVAFAHLLAKNAGTAAPMWAVLYEPFSIFAIVYTLFAWGTIFLTDPVAEAKDKEIATHQEFKRRIADKKKEFLDSVEGEDVIIDAASEEIRREFNPANHRTGRQHFGSRRELPAPENSPVLSRLPQALPRPTSHRTGWKYSSGDLCDLWGMTEVGAGTVLKNYGVGPDKSYEICMAEGFLPQDMTLANFTSIYYELCPDVPGRVRIPDAANRTNGRNP
jgi:hypothetical protein